MWLYCLFNFKTFKNSSRIPQTWMSIYCLFRTPNSEMFQNMGGFLILVHSPLTYSSTSPYGISKPIPRQILSHQMASLSPSPNGIFKPIHLTVTSTSANFLGTLVSNLLLPSSHERQTCQSNSSCSRRLNRGNCCTPKFALAFFHKKSQLQAFPDSSNWLKDRTNGLFSSVKTKLWFY